MSNKAFARLVSLDASDGTPGGTLRVEYVLLDPDDNPVAGGLRGAQVSVNYSDSNHDILRNVSAACRVDASEPDLDVVIIGSVATP